jgi:hypothetical protein
VGELLLGKITDSNAVWVARALTTNDWGVISAEGGAFLDSDIVGNAVTNGEEIASTVLSGNIALARMTNGMATGANNSLSVSNWTTLGTATVLDGSLEAADIGSGNLALARMTNGWAGAVNASVIVSNLAVRGTSTFSAYKTAGLTSGYWELAATQLCYVCTMTNGTARRPRQIKRCNQWPNRNSA